MNPFIAVIVLPAACLITLAIGLPFLLRAPKKKSGKRRIVKQEFTGGNYYPLSETTWGETMEAYYGVPDPEKEIWTWEEEDD
jgi:hypothetical protein